MLTPQAALAKLVRLAGRRGRDFDCAMPKFFAVAKGPESVPMK